MPSQTAPNGGDTLSNSTDPDTDTLSNSNYGRTIPGQTKFGPCVLTSAIRELIRPVNMSAPLVKLQCKPGEIVLYCSVPMSGVGYTYDIYCKPSDTILSVKEQILAPDPHKSRQWKPERPKIALENMYLSVTSLGMLEDDRTLESYGIGVGELNDWIGKQWIEILEI